MLKYTYKRCAWTEPKSVQIDFIMGFVWGCQVHPSEYLVIFIGVKFNCCHKVTTVFNHTIHHATYMYNSMSPVTCPMDSHSYIRLPRHTSFIVEQMWDCVVLWMVSKLVLRRLIVKMFHRVDMIYSAVLGDM